MSEAQKTENRLIIEKWHGAESIQLDCKTPRHNRFA